MTRVHLLFLGENGRQRHTWCGKSGKITEKGFKLEGITYCTDSFGRNFKVTDDTKRVTCQRCKPAAEARL